MEKQQEGHQSASQHGQSQQAASAGEKSTSPADKSPLPGATLPKGGGAIRGMGEKFDANPVTGTGSMTVPIAISPGRDGYGPSLALSYDSGNGNSPFGFGWTLTIDSITRKTSKGLPLYRDDEESDVFLVSGADDLVPLLQKDGTRYEDRTTVPGYVIHRYKPRIESDFHRIERWSNLQDSSDVHWRVYTPDNDLNIYGRSDNSRISNPDSPEQIYSWLLSDCRDWKGNAVVFNYKSENGEGVDLTKDHQRSRGGIDDNRRMANRYIKSIKYGNQTSFLGDQGQRIVFPSESLLNDAGWMFEAVFDYGEHDTVTPTPLQENQWDYRDDAFSSYRSGFEVRTTRICKRVLMFHHFRDEQDVGLNCLVRSTDFIYRQPAPGMQNRVYTFLDAVEQSGYRRDSQESSGYVKGLMPRLEFKYSEPIIDDELKQIDPVALENLPTGLLSPKEQWIDLYGEGIPGILTRSNGAWYYKRNITPINETRQADGSMVADPMFDILEIDPSAPNLALGKKTNFADLTGDGVYSIVTENGNAGYFASDDAESWSNYQPFEKSFKTNFEDPSLYMVDLTGDGLTDVLFIDASLWCPSLGIKGFGEPESFRIQQEENENPIQIFKNDTIGVTHFADITGDGLTDIARINNGEVSVWPNLGYGKFGAKVMMDNAPVFDDFDMFDPDRIILADIDGSGTTDIIYIHRDGAKVYFNESGNSWSEPQILQSLKNISMFLNVSTIDLFGNGTTCLAISSILPHDPYPMRYVDLMGPIKPHLLTQIDNNLGASIKVNYSTSTKFYLQDKMNGTPWITKLAFPLHVVESYQTYDYISRNMFTRRFAYHHGYYDGAEREFRGFGMVEQWDTEELSAVLSQNSVITNSDPSYSLPPSHTKSWFHLGMSTGGDIISKIYETEYFQPTDLWILPDTELPSEITPSEEYDACRTLKGCLLRQEIFVDDAPPGSSNSAIATSRIPYSVIESNFTLTRVQPLAGNCNAVFFVTQRETISQHFERNTKDPRINHHIVLETNEFGQTLREVAIGYGRQAADTTLPTEWDQDCQTKNYLTYALNQVTNAIDDVTKYSHSYRLPVNCERKQYELTGLTPPDKSPFSFDQFFSNNFELLDSATEIGYEITADLSIVQKRILQLSRTLGRKDDLTGLLPLGEMGVCSIPGQSYSLVFSSAMFDKAYQKNNSPLFSSPDAILTSREGDGGGFFSSAQLKSSKLIPVSDRYDGYWMSNNITFYSMSNNPVHELSDAHAHFYRLVRTRNVFGAESSITYDKYDLLVIGTLNAQGNIATIGERDSTGQMIQNGNDYRLLEPLLITDANENRAAVKCDALGAVVGTAIMGKRSQPVGDNFTGFIQDLDPTVALTHLANPIENAKDILQGATTRIVYDLFAYVRTKNTDAPQPAVAYSVSRTTKHEADVVANESIEMRHTFDYSDGFGRVIHSKVQTKPGPVAKRDADGRIIIDPDLGRPVLTDTPSDPRWISSGWAIYDNKGNAVANFEPFFTDRHEFEFDIRVGVSPIIFYDGLGRAMVALHPNHSYVKNMFSTWTIEEWDHNDTVDLDPRTDPDVSRYVASYFAANPQYQTWLQQRATKPPDDLDYQAAQKASAHANTPTVSHLDSLGRVFLKVGWNKVVCEGHEIDGTEWKQYQRVELDILGKGIAVRDANTDSGDLRGRIVESYEYDMSGRAMIRRSMDNGARIWLMNALNQPLYQWDDRGHRIKTTYDKAGRHLFSSVLGDTNTPTGPGSEIVFNYNIFGEHHPQANELNLRGTVYLSVDQAGSTENKSRDFKGNVIDTAKRFNSEYKGTVDWASIEAVIGMDTDPTAVFDEPALQAALDAKLQNEEFTDSMTYDAQNRVLILGSLNSDGKPSKTRFTFVLGCLVKIEANIRAAASPTGDLIWNPGVSDLDYDARGLRSYINYGNGVKTSYTYSNIGELVRLLSTRPTSRGKVETVQDLTYTYDPSQYQTNISDAAQQTVYFRNQVVEPTNDYTYDALYQLIRASGREHLGQPGGSPIPYSSEDSARSGPQPGDESAMGIYTEDYVYGNSGNMKKMKHRISDPTAPGHTWTRIFSQGESSQLEPAKFNNRLSSATVGSQTENYNYDIHGNMIRMPHLGGAGTAPNMEWDFLDHNRKLDLGGGGTAYYVYDRTGERVRKVIERGPNLTQERLYLNGTLEIFRVHQSGQIKLERESMHIMDDKNRVALMETRTLDPDSTDRAPAQVQRYQLASHLKSATIEVDQNAKVLTYEEYSPYGSSTYFASDSSLELPKRYRFTGKERDDESGLFYYGLRYYCPWLARWTSCDPIGSADGLNVFEYCSSNPIQWTDPSGSATGFPDWLANFAKGRDAEKHAAEIMMKAAEGTGETIETEVWIAGRWRNIVKNGVSTSKWVGVKRLDIITKELAVQVKWVGIELNEARDLITSPELRERVLAGLRDATKEVNYIEQHAVGKGWVSNKAADMWKGNQPKHILRFVVDGEEKVVEQFRNFAQTTAMEITTAGEAAHAVEAIAGTGRTVAELLKPAAKVAAAIGGVAMVSLGILGIASAATSLATANNWQDRAVAGLELASSVMTVIPGLNGIGMGMGLAVTAGKMGVAAYHHFNGDGAETAKAPPADEAASPAPAEAPPSKSPAPVEPAPAPPSEPAQSSMSAPAPAPKPSAKKSSGSGGAGAPRMTTLKVMDCKAGHCRMYESKVPTSYINKHIKSHGGK